MVESVRELSRDARRAVRDGHQALLDRQRARLADQVSYARAHSPFYRRLYRHLPDHVEDPTSLPVTDKSLLMAEFDGVVTDRAVTRERVEEFVADPDLIGRPFTESRHLVATSSGTSGIRGLFVLDERNARVIRALGLRSNTRLGLRRALRVLARRGRTAVVTAPRGHFYTVASAERIRLEHPWLGGLARVFPIDRPLPELVAELNAYDPAVVAGFPSMIMMLAAEQEAGRLRIDPEVIAPGGETITDRAWQRLADVFRAQVRAVYAATECFFLSHWCDQHWYHVNIDWAVLEPVDADHRPVPPGEPSHTVLVSNLANRVQPFLRYDLGDSVLVRPDPCPCGSPLPAIRVQGRAADLLAFDTGAGRTELSPMLFGTVLDRVDGLDRYQLVQTAPDVLRVRLRPRAGADPERVWRTVRTDLAGLLDEHGAAGVVIERAAEQPEQSAGGKLRRVVALQQSSPGGV